MNTVQTQKPFSVLVWLALGLAVFTAAAYLLIAWEILPVGDLQVATDGGIIIYVAAGCYLFGGLLILVRRNWLWAVGVVINALVVMFFFKMYQTRPVVMFSPGGLLTKIPQILLEVNLLVLLVAQWINSRRRLG